MLASYVVLLSLRSKVDFQFLSSEHTEKELAAGLISVISMA